MIDHLDWLDYTFLGFCTFILAAAIYFIMPYKPYRQIDRKPVEPDIIEK